MSPLVIILIVVLLVVALGGGWGYRAGWGGYPHYGTGLGIVGVVLLVVVLLLLMGRI